MATAHDTPQSQAPVNALVNSVVKNLSALATRAFQKRWIITFTAPTGVGKSTAVDYAERGLPFDRLVIRCKSITTRYSILHTMGLEPGEKWNTHGRNWMRASDLYARIVEKVRERPYLLRRTACARTVSRCSGTFGMTPGCRSSW
jgi:hypothetical protein